jgi:hypothetical protein
MVYTGGVKTSTTKPRAARERKGQLSPDAERLITAALGLTHSGSRVEDRFWEDQLSGRIARLLDSGHAQSLIDALERLQQTDQEAYGALLEAVEETTETAVFELDGAPMQAILVCAPVVAWTRFSIPSGAIEATKASQLSALWSGCILAEGARFAMAPYLYSVDQLPGDFTEVRKQVRKLGQAALGSAPVRMDVKGFPDTAEMLADSRFLLGVVVVAQGSPVFRWQQVEPKAHATRVACLEQWIAQARPVLEPMLAGCGFECLLPDAYHMNLRESDRRVRPYALQAGVHFLTHLLKVEPDAIRAAVAPFGQPNAEEYRIGLFGKDETVVMQGVVWPLYGPEAQPGDDTALETIREVLRQVGVTEVRLWPTIIEPEFCEDCGAPLFPNGVGDVVHTELPEDVEPYTPHFH